MQEAFDAGIRDFGENLSLIHIYGMLCSGEELCIKDSDYPGAEVYGILILKEEYAPGTDMREVLMMNDTVIEFEVGANRPDCLSVLGIAKEAAAALEEAVKPVSYTHLDVYKRQRQISIWSIFRQRRIRRCARSWTMASTALSRVSARRKQKRTRR